MKACHVSGHKTSCGFLPLSAVLSSVWDGIWYVSGPVVLVASGLPAGGDRCLLSFSTQIQDSLPRAAACGDPSVRFESMLLCEVTAAGALCMFVCALY